MRVRFEFKKEDLWVGAFWRSVWRGLSDRRQHDLWICLLPTLPLRLTWETERPNPIVERMRGT